MPRTSACHKMMYSVSHFDFAQCSTSLSVEGCHLFDIRNSPFEIHHCYIFHTNRSSPITLRLRSVGPPKSQIRSRKSQVSNLIPSSFLYHLHSSRSHSRCSPCRRGSRCRRCTCASPVQYR